MIRDKKYRLRFIYTIFIIVQLFATFQIGFAQNTSFLSDGVNDFLRRSQLLGNIDIHSSLINGSFSANYKGIDSLIDWKSRSVSKDQSRLTLHYLPMSVVQQYNSHHAYGWNDEGMIPAKGLQTMVSGGIEASMGHFSLQFKPEIVYAQNPPYETFPTEHYDIIWQHYYQWLNKSDIPERFGDKTYKHFFPGQSSIRYNTGVFSAGLSTENLWWGPGIRNALVMSNNAPGFVHFTFNTIKPVSTKIGTFEGQFIAGSLSSSGILPPGINRHDASGNPLYIPKKEESRYISGLVFSWQPKWVKGLFLGFTSVSYLYRSDISGIGDIFPLQGIIQSQTEKNKRKASLGSLFARYVMPEDKAELYFEYGRDDKVPNLLNVITDNGYPRAYVAGFRKMFPARRKAYIQFVSEFTQMQLPTVELIESASSWYTNTYVRQGYTNNGQVIGAGIGPGTNSQMIDISWVKGFSRVGVQFERIAHNSDFYNNTFVITHDPTRHWIDLSTTFHLDWRVNRFLLSSQLALVRSLNYEWYVFPDLGYFKNGYDVLNFQGKLSFAYQL